MAARLLNQCSTASPFNRLESVATRPIEFQDRLGRFWRSVDQKQRFDRRRHIQIHRWRRKLDQHGFEGLRTHRQDSRRSQDSNNVLACATGHIWNDNDERGVFKTSDGGKNWKKVPLELMGHGLWNVGNVPARTENCLARCGISAGKDGLSAPAGPGSGCLNRPTGRTLGRNK